MWNCMSIRNHCCAQLVCLIEIYYELNWTYWCAQWGSILGTQWEVMYSTGHYWCVQQESILSAQQDIIGVLKERLGAQWEVRCAMGSYVLN